jgi:hypothetical protein
MKLDCLPFANPTHEPGNQESRRGDRLKDSDCAKSLLELRSVAFSQAAAQC